MDTEIREVTIVGGGDSGLLAGLSLRRTNPDLDIRVVDDFEREIPQVGKSTYHKITTILHEFLGIDEERFMSEVKPVWKGSVYFRDWCGYGPFHFPFDNVTKFPEEHTPRAAEHEYHYYETLYDSPDHRSKGEEIVEQRASPMYYAPESGRYRKYRYVAYHLNTERFNSSLRDRCRDRGISLVPAFGSAALPYPVTEGLPVKGGSPRDAGLDDAVLRRGPPRLPARYDSRSRRANATTRPLEGSRPRRVAVDRRRPAPVAPSVRIVHRPRVIVEWDGRGNVTGFPGERPRRQS